MILANNIVLIGAVLVSSKYLTARVMRHELIYIALPDSNAHGRLGAFYSKYAMLVSIKYSNMRHSSICEHNTVYYVYQSRLFQHRRVHEEGNLWSKSLANNANENGICTD